MVKIEVCVADLQSALAAYQGGAQRVELCDNLAEGGTTPSFGLIAAVREQLPILVNVLIRPRGGDFVYDSREIALMQQDIQQCANLRCDGVVLGALTAQGEIDIDNMQRLVAFAKQLQLSVTFHRAFDCCQQLEPALETIIALGCDTLLTSGGYNSVLEGQERLASLVKQAADRIVIMPGSGVTLENIVDIVKHTGVQWIHGSFRRTQLSRMHYFNPTLARSCGMYDTKQSDPTQIAQAVAKIAGINAL